MKIYDENIVLNYRKIKLLYDIKDLNKYFSILYIHNLNIERRRPGIFKDIHNQRRDQTPHGHVNLLFGLQPLFLREDTGANWLGVSEMAVF